MSTSSAAGSPRRLRFSMTDWGLFWKKTVSVFVLAFALVPLMGLKTDVPAVAYAGGLVVLHIGILAIYFYRVRFRELDPDRRSLIARLVGLALTTYILTETSQFAPGEPLGVLALKMLFVSLVHMVMLVLLMVRIHPRAAAADLVA